MKNMASLYGMLLLSAFLFFSCSGTKEQHNQLTDKEKGEGWTLLFDGTSTNGWHLYNHGKIPSVWTVTDGELNCKPNGKSERGDLVSDKEFSNYELRFEWKIAQGGNSGVFINVVERPDIPAAWASGPEYQLLDNAHPDHAKATVRSGCLYGLSAQKNPVGTKPSGEWNQSRIRQEKGKIEFYLNDVLTAQQDLTTQAWADTISHTYFNNFPEFGKHINGHIGLQDWGMGVSFRNIKIKEL